MKKVKNEVILKMDEAILKGQDVISDQAWALYKKIGGSYKHRSHAWKDMIELGKIASQLMALESARPNLWEELE